MVAVDNLITSAVFAVFVLFALDSAHMDLDEFGYGVLMTGIAAGAIVGTISNRRGAAAGPLQRAVPDGVGDVRSHARAGPDGEPTGSVRGAGDRGVMMMMWNIITVSLRQTHHARPSAGPSQRQLPPLRLGSDAHRRPPGGPHRGGLRDRQRLRRGRAGQPGPAGVPHGPDRRGHRCRRAAPGAASAPEAA